MARRNFSKETLIKRFTYCGGRCEGTLENGKRCDVILVPGRWHGDHHDPDAMTGEPTFENCRCLCLPCHAVKTKLDVANIAKAKRRQAKHIGAEIPKPKMQGPKFTPAAPQRKASRPLAKPSLPPIELYKDLNWSMDND